MTQRAKIPPRSWLAIVGRATPAFTPAYAPAPPTFWGQLWAALTRSTPAFTGAWLPDVTDAPADSALPLLDTAFAEVVLPTFLSSDRAQSFARENGHVLALCLARQRELGLRIAQQMTLDNIYYFTKELKLYRAMGLQHIFAGYLRAVAQALSLALTLNRLIAHDLTNGQAQHRAYARRRKLARARSRVRDRILLLDYAYRRKHRTKVNSRMRKRVAAFTEFLVDIFYNIYDFLADSRIGSATRSLTEFLTDSTVFFIASLPFRITAEGLRRMLSALRRKLSGFHGVRDIFSRMLLWVLDSVRFRPVTVPSRRVREKALAFKMVLYNVERGSTSGVPVAESSPDLSELLRMLELVIGLRQTLSNVDLMRVELPGAQLAEADLRGSNLNGANLPGANLSCAILEGAKLSETHLNGADLSGANLADVDLSDADLTGADLTGARMNRVSLRGVLWSELTAWPPSVDRYIRANSRQIRPGIYQVDEGGERHPNHDLMPAR